MLAVCIVRLQQQHAAYCSTEPQPSYHAGSLLFTQLILTGWVEAKRWADYKNPGSQGDGSFFGLTDDFVAKENGYPGGIFDPFNLAEGPAYEEYKVNLSAACCRSQRFLTYHLD